MAPGAAFLLHTWKMGMKFQAYGSGQAVVDNREGTGKWELAQKQKKREERAWRKALVSWVQSLESTFRTLGLAVNEEPESRNHMPTAASSYKGSTPRILAADSQGRVGEHNGTGVRPNILAVFECLGKLKAGGPDLGIN